MKVEILDLHGYTLDLALEKAELNMAWAFKHDVSVLVFNHGKGYHSQRDFSIIKSELRKKLKLSISIKDAGYLVINGESDHPISLSYDAGHTLLVKKGLENQYIGSKTQKEKNEAIYSSEGRKKRKDEKKLRQQKKKR